MTMSYQRAHGRGRSTTPASRKTTDPHKKERWERREEEEREG
jgi:hypothetical protein